MPTQRIATIRGTTAADAFYFPLRVNQYVIYNMILDTRAFELTFGGQVATAMRLPNLGPIQIGGVGGEAAAYLSICTIYLGDWEFRNVPCIVDMTFPGSGLFGLKFFIVNRLKLELDPSEQILTILRTVSRPQPKPEVGKPKEIETEEDKQHQEKEEDKKETP